MDKLFDHLKRVAISSASLNTITDAKIEAGLHPFDQRNIHPDLTRVSMQLFDDGHFSQATFESFKLLDKEVGKIANSSESGFNLMMNAFKDKNPPIALTALSNVSEKDIQKGFCFLFAGSVMAIRNPAGHEVGNLESMDDCLDRLSFASLLLRRLRNRHKP